MKGFDPRWKDFPDYILGITEEIWEGRDMDALARYYAPDVIVRTPGGVTTDCQSVIDATLAVMAEFPDRIPYGEDVIWCGSPEKGMLSSHRLFSAATHTGEGAHGPAAGKPLLYRAIADCHAVNNQINDEWLVRDQGAVVRQIGRDPADFARDSIAREGGPENCAKPFTPADDVPGPYKGRGNDNEWGARAADILTRIMNANSGVFAAEYDRICALEYAGGVSDRTPAGAERFWAGLRESFPAARFTVDHQIGRDDPLSPPRAALRWSLHGKHGGNGVFGPPTGAEVHIMGFTHAEFGPWGLRREYTLYDEVSVWKQIILGGG